MCIIVDKINDFKAFIREDVNEDLKISYKKVNLNDINCDEVVGVWFDEAFYGIFEAYCEFIALKDMYDVINEGKDEVYRDEIQDTLKEIFTNHMVYEVLCDDIPQEDLDEIFSC